MRQLLGLPRGLVKLTRVANDDILEEVRVRHLVVVDWVLAGSVE